MASERQFVVMQSRALRDPELGPAAKLVLCALGDFTNPDGVCWPSVETLAARASLSRRTVFRALDALVDRGWLRKVRRGPKTTLYQVVQDRPLDELKAEYSGADTLDDAAQRLVENTEKKCHDGTSFPDGGERGDTMTPLEVPPWHTEGSQGTNCSSSSPRDASTLVVNSHADAEQPAPAADTRVPESRVGEDVAPPAASPAALRAPTSPAPATDQRVDRVPVGIAGRFTDPDHAAAYLAYRRGHRFPVALDAELRTLNEPMTGGAAVPWDVIGRQLLQLQANGSEFNARLFAGYCRSAMAVLSAGEPKDRESSPPARARAHVGDRSTATRSAFIELVDRTSDKAKERAS